MQAACGAPNQKKICIVNHHADALERYTDFRWWIACVPPGGTVLVQHTVGAGTRLRRIVAKEQQIKRYCESWLRFVQLNGFQRPFYCRTLRAHRRPKAALLFSFGDQAFRITVARPGSVCRVSVSILRIDTGKSAKCRPHE